jgi:hypothetical protein
MRITLYIKNRREVVNSMVEAPAFAGRQAFQLL